MLACIAPLLLILNPAPAHAQEDSVAVAVPDSVALDSATIAADTLRDSHPQDSPDVAGFLFETPDQKGQLRLRASIRLNGAWDFNGLQNTDVFDTYQIPVGDVATEQARFFLQATQSRIGFELSSVTSGGVVFGRIEADFRGQGDAFRLRHAYGEFWRVLAGQTWSNFSDVEAIPVTVDFEGPPSSNNVRTPQIRYTQTASDSTSWSVALEAPKADVTDPEEVDAEFQGFGDVTARARLVSDWGHLQISGVFRSLAANDTTGNTDFLPGLGIMLSGSSQVAENDKFRFQAIGGIAISRFVGSLGGKGLDLLFNPDTGKFEQVTSYGGFVTWTHKNLFDRPVETNLTGGILGVANKSFQPDDSYRSSQYMSANIFWRFTEGGRAGVEWSWGLRQNKDGQSGQATRLSFAAYFDF
ncbi:MAG: DcaP family trimeric outer membrane transporter [marine benthic group bacterium]|nr:DcaP family trimeric outer membrane transporter [Gemmatimonadota bacterium]